MNLTYEKCGDYLIPMLKDDKDYLDQLGKYGYMRKKFLQEHYKEIYEAMILDGRLWRHLETIQIIAEKKMELLVLQFCENEGITEALKEESQIFWVNKMNCVREQAEEIVLNEIIYNIKEDT